MRAPVFVVFACVRNAGRSQMAAAFFNRLVRPERGWAASAGTDPGAHVHPEVVAAMSEAGIDLSDVRPQRLTTELALGAAWLITMGCGDACPIVPHARRDDWPVADPDAEPLDRVRQIRDEIRDRVARFVRQQGLD